MYSGVVTSCSGFFRAPPICTANFFVPGFGCPLALDCVGSIPDTIGAVFAMRCTLHCIDTACIALFCILWAFSGMFTLKRSNYTSIAQIRLKMNARHLKINPDILQGFTVRCNRE